MARIYNQPGPSANKKTNPVVETKQEQKPDEEKGTKDNGDKSGK